MRKSRPQTLFFMGREDLCPAGPSACAGGRGAKVSGSAVAAEERVYLEHFQEQAKEAIEPVLTGMGLSLVEMCLGRRKGTTRVSVVIYRHGGVGVDDCAEVSDLLLPRLEMIEGMAEVSLEVSSPGIERTLRSPSEYTIFAGRGLRVLVGKETEWQGGIIEGVEGDMLWLRRGRERKGFAVGEIRRARLDYSVEVEETKNAV